MKKKAVKKPSAEELKARKKKIAAKCDRAVNVLKPLVKRKRNILYYHHTFFDDINRTSKRMQALSYLLANGFSIQAEL